MILPFALAFAAGMLTAFLPTAWTSQAVLEFPPLPSALDFAIGMEKLPTGATSLKARLEGKDETIERHVAILRSERIRTQVAEKPSLKGALSSLLGIESKPKMLRALRKRSHFKAQPGRMVVIKVTMPGPSLVSRLLGRSPKQAQETAAATAGAYIEELRDYLRDISASHERSEREYLDVEVEDARRRLLQLQEEQVALREQGLPLWPQEERPLLTEGLGKLEHERAVATVELAAARRESATARARLEDADEAVLENSERTRNPEIQRLQAQLNDAQTRYQVLRNIDGKLDRHPEVREAAESIRQTERKLQDALTEPLQIDREQQKRNPVYVTLQQVYNEAIIEEATTRAKLTALDRVRDQYYARLENLTDRELWQIRLEADYELESAMYATLRKALEEVKIAAKRHAAIFVVLDAPQPPDRKSKPSTVLNSLGGLVVGIFLVFIFVELRSELLAWYGSEETASRSENTEKPQE